MTLRSLDRSGRAAAARIRVRSRIVLMITRISNCANEAPMQRRTPPPNGIHVYASGVPCRNRSGRNSSGSGYRSSRKWIAAIAGITSVPAGRR